MKNSEAMTYQSVQTIAFSSKDINAIFIPIVVELSKRWQGVLKNKYKYYTRMSPQRFEDIFNDDFDVFELFGYERVENDIPSFVDDESAFTKLFHKVKGGRYTVAQCVDQY